MSCVQKIVSPASCACRRCLTRYTPEKTAAGTVERSPNSLIQLTAFTCASLFKRLIELVDEFDALHSTGIKRPANSLIAIRPAAVAGSPM